MMEAFFTWLAVACGFGAAGTWFLATRVYVVHKPVERDGWISASVTVEKGGREIDPFATADRQNFWNTIAAALTGATALFQALAMLMHKGP